MTLTSDQILLRRFGRTVRVAAATLLAEYQLTAGRSFGTAVTFRALAAKSADAWRFPEAGLLAVDGLILATVIRDQAGHPERLRLQAQGATGLELWAGRAVRVSFGLPGDEIDTAFDGRGAADLPLSGLDLAEEELASFDMTAITEG